MTFIKNSVIYSGALEWNSLDILIQEILMNYFNSKEYKKLGCVIHIWIDKSIKILKKVLLGLELSAIIFMTTKPSVILIELCFNYKVCERPPAY